MWRRSVARVYTDCAGIVLLEYALTLPLLLLVVLGIVDFGFLFREYLVVTNAAREGARMAVLPGSGEQTYSEAQVKQRVAAYLTAGGVDSTLTQKVDCDPATKNVTVTIEFEYTFKFLGPLVQWWDKTFGKLKLPDVISGMRTEVGCP